MNDDDMPVDKATRYVTGVMVLFVLWFVVLLLLQVFGISPLAANEPEYQPCAPISIETTVEGQCP